MYIWILIGYWVAAVTLVVMALALYERLKVGSPALVQTATVFGFIWAGLIIGSGNLMLFDFGVVADLYGQDPAQAETVWLALEAVENGIVSGNELVGGLWVLLLSWAALRTGGLPKALNIIGTVTGVLSVVFTNSICSASSVKCRRSRPFWRFPSPCKRWLWRYG